MFHGSPAAADIIGLRAPRPTSEGFTPPRFLVPPPSQENEGPDTAYEGVYLTPSFITALSYAGIPLGELQQGESKAGAAVGPADGGRETVKGAAGVIVCAVRLGRIYNEFLDGPDAAREAQLASLVRKRREHRTKAAPHPTTDAAPLGALDFDTRISWLDEGAVYCVVDPRNVIPLLCLQ